MPRRPVTLLLSASSGASAVTLLLALSDCGSRTPLDVALASTVVDAAADADGPAVPCVPGVFALERAEPAVMFVLDRSTSMRQRIPTPNGSASRWSVLTDSLAATLPAIDSTANIGALFYPTHGASLDQCTVSSAVDLTPAEGRVSELVKLMRSSTPVGATPTAEAIDAAGRSLTAFRAATSARSLVLATDGAPDCNTSLDPRSCRCSNGGGTGGCGNATRCLDDTRTVQRIQAWAARGIPTYVVGIASATETTFRDVLDAMAVAGGRARAQTPHYYSAASETELTFALGAIRDQVGACTFLTSSVPSDRGAIVVSADGAELTYDETGATGWRWGSKGNGEIILAPGVCGGGDAGSLVANVRCEAPGDGAIGDARAEADARLPARDAGLR